MVYGALMGFGYKTAWGLGQTLLEPLEEKQELFEDS
jgi:CRISPR-associated endoribonuclease Cas6